MKTGSVTGLPLAGQQQPIVPTLVKRLQPAPYPFDRSDGPTALRKLADELESDRGKAVELLDAAKSVAEAIEIEFAGGVDAESAWFRDVTRLRRAIQSCEE